MGDLWSSIIAHNIGHRFFYTKSIGERKYEAEMENVRRAGTVKAFNGAVQRPVEEIMREAKNIAGNEEYFICCQWYDQKLEDRGHYLVIVRRTD